jgi:hypothetical protein
LTEAQFIEPGCEPAQYHQGQEDDDHPAQHFFQSVGDRAMLRLGLSRNF